MRDQESSSPSIPFEPDPVIEAYKQGIDRTLLRENLNRTVQERLDRLVELQQRAAELKKAGDRLRAES